MRKELLIFGSEGALGKGVTKILSEKDFDKIYLFDRNLEPKSTDKFDFIKVKDLTQEENVLVAFN